MMKLALCVVLSLAVAVLALNDQLNPFEGTYYSDCQAFGGQGSGLYSKHFVGFLNNGHFIKIYIWVNPPTGTQCAGGWDLELTKMGVININMGTPTNPAATNMDIGQEFKHMRPLTQNGVAYLTANCQGVTWGLNNDVDVTNLNCPALNISPFTTCPMHYTIVQKTATGLTMATPSCSILTRPSDFSSAVPANQAFAETWFGGLWQSGCFESPNPQFPFSFSTEMEILPGGMFDFSGFWYTAPGCDSSSLGLKMSGFGEFLALEPSHAVPGAVDIEILRRSHTWYITSPQVLAHVNQAMINGSCGGGFQFALNTLTDVSTLDCPQLHVASLQHCPKIYDIAMRSGEQMFMGGDHSQQGDLCNPAGRPSALHHIGATNVRPMHFGGGNSTGLAVVFSLLLIGVVAGGVWFCIKNRGNSLNVFKNACCGQSYQETA